MQNLAAADILAACALGASRLRNSAPRSIEQMAITLIDVLAERFPVVRRLSGDQSFLGAARGYVFTQPPRAANILYYDGTFPHFLQSLGDCASIEYVADIAALEWACHKARYAPSAPLADTLQLSRPSTTQLRALRVVLHPSVSLIVSRFPVVTIWEANRSSSDPPVICRWNAESALVAGLFRSVEIRRLPAGGYDFLRALQSGATIGDGADAGCAAATDFDMASNLALLTTSNIMVDVR